MSNNGMNRNNNLKISSINNKVLHHQNLAGIIQKDIRDNKSKEDFKFNSNYLRGVGINITKEIGGGNDIIKSPMYSNNPNSIQKRGNSTSQMNFPSFNDNKTTRQNKELVENNLNSRTNLRKDSIKFNEKNQNKNNNEYLLLGSLSKSPLSNFTSNKYNMQLPKDNMLKMSVNLPNASITNTQRNHQNKYNEHFSGMNNTNNKFYNELTESSSNINSVYNELAKQLKSCRSSTTRNKGIVVNTEITLNKIPTEDNHSNINSNSNLNTNTTGLKLIKSYDQSYSNLDLINPASNYNRNRTNKPGTERYKSSVPNMNSITTMGLTKTTKDSNGSGVNLSTFKVINYAKVSSNDIEGPEELHFFYVNIFHNNKKLAYKFDKLNTQEDELSQDDI